VLGFFPEKRIFCAWREFLVVITSTQYPVMSAEYFDIHETAAFDFSGMFGDFGSNGFLPESSSGTVMVFEKGCF